MHTLKIGILKDMFHQLPKYKIIEKLDICEWEHRKGVFNGEDGYSFDELTDTVKPGDILCGSYDVTHIMKARVTVPQSMDGLPLRARFAVGGEALVKCNGKYIAGCTTRDYMPDRANANLGTAKGGEVLDIEIESTIDSMAYCDQHLGGAQYQECRIADTSIFTIDPVVEAYIFDIQVAFEAYDELKDDHIKAKLYAAIDDSLHIVDYDFEPDQVRESIHRAHDYYNECLRNIKWTPQSKVILTGHSHIDVAWLWRVQESIRKSARTFTNVTTLMDEYPEMTFGQSQAVLYDMTKKHYPEIYEKIKEKVAANQWDICGNVWVEADTNVASGESLIRQVLYGTEFFKREFGKVSKTYWLPDCFGFTAALPQIIKGCGMENFITSKLSYNDTTKFPYNMFMWEGNNGDKVYAHLMRPAYNCDFKPWEIKYVDDECNNKSELTTSMGFYGLGDGGGGPTREMLERGKRLKNFPGLPSTEIGHIDDFFETYHGFEDELPTWWGEMYYENHRGTFTSQAFVKKNNRKGEYLLTRNEMMGVILESLTGKIYPRESIEKAWHILMTNQFHDILPGSSIHEVYEDAKKTYAEMNGILNDVKEDNLNKLCACVSANANTVTVWNFTSVVNTAPITVANVPTNLEIKDYPSVNEDGILTFKAPVAPMSYRVFELKEKSPIILSVIAPDARVLENDRIRVELDDAGFITSVYDKVNNRESISDKGNILSVSLDKCIHETAWNLELNYRKKMWILDKADSIEVIEDNELRKIIRVVKSFNKSTITQDYILYCDSDYIEFDTTVDWHETDKVLKAGFDVTVIDTEATYDIAHGTYRRPTHYNTAYDLTRFEVAAHKWADLSEGSYGCSIINDCKYGYDIYGSHMRITLMRAPTCPDPVGDHGINTFKYAFRPHSSDWRNGTVAESISFNIPCYACYNTENIDGILKENNSFVEISEENISIEALKKAQDNNGYILRVVDDKQFRGKCTVKLGIPFTKVFETNMIEENKEELEVVGNSFTFEYKPFEVKTFRII